MKAPTMLMTLALAACAKQAPGTHPTDMTAIAHRDECIKHRQNAVAADRRADEASRSTYPKSRYPIQDEAKREREIADQHATAALTAEATEGGSAQTSHPRCE